MRVGVFFSCGLGNAVLLIPLINAMRADGHSVVGIFTSKYACNELFAFLDILDEKVILQNKWISLVKSVFSRIEYDIVFLDRFSNNRSNLFYADRTSRKIVSQFRNPDFVSNKISIIRPEPPRHMVLMNLQLGGYKADMIHFQKRPKPKDYAVFQPGGGTGQTSWKIWRIENWARILNLINIELVVIGDSNDAYLGKQMQECGFKFTNLIGKTSVAVMTEIVAGGSFYLGHDSGPMHIAAIHQVPTFTVWGGSSPMLYGYDQIAPELHTVIYSNPSCGPCDSWLAPNRSKVNHPQDCPYLECLELIQVDAAINLFNLFLKKVANSLQT